jgi:hypothetical protein
MADIAGRITLKNVLAAIIPETAPIRDQNLTRNNWTLKDQASFALSRKVLSVFVGKN